MAAVLATVTAKPKPSSIAPREVARKEPPSKSSSAALIGLGMLALLGAGALYRSNTSKSPNAAASTAPHGESVPIAQPQTHLVATEPARVVEPLPPVEVKADARRARRCPRSIRRRLRSLSVCVNRVARKAKAGSDRAGRSAGGAQPQDDR